jgi:hypothetical protein
MPAIQGNATQYSAAIDVSAKADNSVRVNYSAAQNNFSSATYYYYDNVESKYRMVGGACETNTGVFTMLSRLARHRNLDYKAEGRWEDGTLTRTVRSCRHVGGNSSSDTAGCRPDCCSGEGGSRISLSAWRGCGRLDEVGLYNR